MEIDEEKKRGNNKAMKNVGRKGVRRKEGRKEGGIAGRKKGMKEGKKKGRIAER